MLRRIVPASAAAALLVTGLAACSVQSESIDDCVAPYSPGVLSDGVTVSGEIGERPVVSLPEDISIKTTQRTLITDDRDPDASVADVGSMVGVNLTAFDNLTGEQLYESAGFDSGTPEYVFVSEDQPNPLTDALRCAAAGDRVVIALSPSDSSPFGVQLGASGIGSVVFVADVVSSRELASQGRVQGLPTGFPAVVTDESGQPGVVLPPRPAPEGMTDATRIVGEGETVGADDTVVLQVLDVKWDGLISQNSWDNGPIAIPGETESESGGLTYRGALTGHTVGSQVVVTENQGENHRVVVVDILAVI